MPSLPQLPFFVYGTLLPGQPNAGYWQSAITSRTPAELRGASLYDQGYYPVMIEGEQGTVRGLVIAISPKSYDHILAALDYLEGYDPSTPHAGEYRRVRRVVRTTAGRSVVAWVYSGRREMRDFLEPIGNDWKRYARSRQPAIDTWWRAVATVRKPGN